MVTHADLISLEVPVLQYIIVSSRDRASATAQADLPSADKCHLVGHGTGGTKLGLSTLILPTAVH